MSLPFFKPRKITAKSLGRKVRLGRVRFLQSSFFSPTRLAILNAPKLEAIDLLLSKIKYRKAFLYKLYHRAYGNFDFGGALANDGPLNQLYYQVDRAVDGLLGIPQD